MDKIVKIIEAYNLVPATKREMSLFNLSSCFYTYFYLINQTLKFTFRGLGAKGKHGEFHALFDEDLIIKKTTKIIEESSDHGKEILKKARVIYYDCLDSIEKIKSTIKTSPKDSLREIVKITPRFWICLGTYNSLWRYLGNENNKYFSKLKIEKLAQERAEAAHLYTKIDDLLKKVLKNIYKDNKFRSELLINLTYSEMVEYAKTFNITSRKLKELEKRASGYFYYAIKKEGKEHVITDLEKIKAIEKRVFNIKKSDILKKDKNFCSGHVVYKGKVRGKVYNMESKRHKVKERMVLVAVATEPKHINLIKKSKAIVTDEGGVLSHTAIIARELKKPCIIGTKYATQIFKDGDLVEVDANKGRVKKIN